MNIFKLPENVLFMSGELHLLLLLNYNLLESQNPQLRILWLFVLSRKKKILILKNTDASVNLYGILKHIT